jgi:hypothetical protein
MYMTGGKVVRVRCCQSCGRIGRTTTTNDRRYFDLCGECKAAFLKSGLSLRKPAGRLQRG